MRDQAEQLFLHFERENRRKARDLAKRCFEPGCDKIAGDRCHFVQRRGLLSEVAEYSHVYELREAFHDAEWPHRSRFDRIGCKEAFTFRGFCEHHDDKIFAPIEKQAERIHLRSEISALLFSYRALLNELRKKEKNLDWMEYNFHDPRLADSPRRAEWESVSDRESFALQCAAPVVAAFNHDIAAGKSSHFSFEIIETPRLPVITSATYGASVVVGETAATWSVMTKWNFVTVLPAGESTLVIVGTTGNASELQRFAAEARRSADVTQRYITDVMIRWCETWCCHPCWYRQEVAPRESQILQAIDFYASAEAKAALPLGPMNLFVPWRHETPWRWR